LRVERGDGGVEVFDVAQLQPEQLDVMGPESTVERVA